MILLRIRENHAHSIAVWRGPFLDSNRGRLGRNSGIAPGPPPDPPQFRPEFEQSLAAISWQKWRHFEGPLAAHDFPHNPGKSRGPYRYLDFPF